MAFFIPREESKDKLFDDLELTGIDTMPSDILDTSVEGRQQLLHHLTHMDPHIAALIFRTAGGQPKFCLLYTSDAADE